MEEETIVFGIPVPSTNKVFLAIVVIHIAFILLLTGFYVDNGKDLPFWRQFPRIFFWVFPAIVRMPIIIYALLKHPLNRKSTA